MTHPTHRTRNRTHPTHRTRNRTTLAALAAAALLLTGCGASTSATPTPSSTAMRGDITVFAAASLTATFTEIADAFEQANPGANVTFNFAGSSALVTQLTEGARADVFASADEANMKKATDAGLVAGDPVIFASNTLEIAVPPGNPAGVSSFADLDTPGLRLVICAPQVPCGAATQKIATALGMTLAPVSEENAVTDVLGKVASGEADAGVVYRTDVQGAGSKVEGISFPETDDAVNRYPIAVLEGSAEPGVAQAFIDLVNDYQGQAILAVAGFGKG